MAQQRKKLNPNKVNLTVDIAIFVAFLIAMAPRFSGLVIHEWLSIGFGAALFVHLLLHWQWIVEITKRFFRTTTWMARINYVLNSLLFIAMTVVMLSGILISEIALPSLGISVGETFAWRRIHEMSADWSVFLIGAHVALHWQWIWNALKRYVVALFLPKRTPSLKPAEIPVALQVKQKVQR
jgi:hypothetical protein